jgi:hypothetical protein
MSATKQHLHNRKQKNVVYFTEEQQIRILRDEAMFSDSTALRKRAIVELSGFGVAAIPAIQEVIDSMTAKKDDDCIFLENFCRTVITDIEQCRICSKVAYFSNLQGK